MGKALKLIVGLLLLPLVYASTTTFVAQLGATKNWTMLDQTVYWFLGGFAIWILLFFMLPRPIRTYVLAHELTHALWGMLMGARVSRLRVSRNGGSVTLTKTNFLITLAPYFFPFYSILALAAFVLISLRWDMDIYRPFWYAVFGLTWSFHVTFTLDMIGSHQPDIQEHGRVFSYAVVYCINMLTAAFLVNLLTTRPLHTLTSDFQDRVTTVYSSCWSHVEPGIAILKSRW